MREVQFLLLRRWFVLIFTVYILHLKITCSQEQIKGQRKSSWEQQVKGRLKTEHRRITVPFAKGYINNDGSVRFPVMGDSGAVLPNDGPPLPEQKTLPETTDLDNMDSNQAQTAQGKTINSDSVKKGPPTKDTLPGGEREQHVPIAKGYVNGDGSFSFPVFENGRRVGIRRADGEVVLFSNPDSKASGP